MPAGSLVKGWKAHAFSTYTDGYTVGSAKEPAYSYLVLTSNITFGGFWSGYPVGTEGLLIFVQDATGGRTIDWNNQITFVGGSKINLAANSVTAVDIVKSPIGWLGFLRDVPQASYVTQVNGKGGSVSLVAGDLPIVDSGNYYASSTVEGALQEIYVDLQTKTENPRELITSAVASFDLVQQHAQKIVRLTASSPVTVNLNRVNFNLSTLPVGSEFVVTNRGTSTVTFAVNANVSLSTSPGTSTTLSPGQSLRLRYTSENGTVMFFDAEGIDPGSTIGLQVIQAASAVAARTALGMDVLTYPQVGLPGKKFDGSTMYMSATAASMGIADGQKGSLFFALRFANAASTVETLLSNGRFTIQRTATGDITVTGRDATNTVVMLFSTVLQPCSQAGFYTLMVSWDLSTAGTGRLYVNDVSDYGETTYSVGQTINYNSGSWFLGADTSAANKLNGDIYLMWFDPTARMGFNTAANRRKFIDANNVPVFLGRKGELPTGSQVALFNGYFQTPSWKVNRGSFVFTWNDNGTPTASATRMPAQYGESEPTGNGLGAPGTEIGLRIIKQSQIITGPYTIAADDSGCQLYHPTTDTTARTITIPANASVPFPIGTVITIDNDFGAGVVTIAITSDTLVLVGTAGTTGSRTLASGGQATIMKVTSTRWRISGTGLT